MAAGMNSANARRSVKTERKNKAGKDSKKLANTLRNKRRKAIKTANTTNMPVRIRTSDKKGKETTYTVINPSN